MANGLGDLMSWGHCRVTQSSLGAPDFPSSTQPQPRARAVVCGGGGPISTGRPLPSTHCPTGAQMWVLVSSGVRRILDFAFVRASSRSFSACIHSPGWWSVGLRLPIADFRARNLTVSDCI